jgi:hypothetical protein
MPIINSASIAVNFIPPPIIMIVGVKAITFKSPKMIVRPKMIFEIFLLKNYVTMTINVNPYAIQC